MEPHNAATANDEVTAFSPAPASPRAIDISDGDRPVAAPLTRGEADKAATARRVQLQKAFKTFDKDGSGAISAEELAAILSMPATGNKKSLAEAKVEAEAIISKCACHSRLLLRFALSPQLLATSSHLLSRSTPVAPTSNSRAHPLPRSSALPSLAGTT